MNESKQNPIAEKPAAEMPSASGNDESKGISRRAALFGALLAGATSMAKEAKAADVDCACLPAPDCSAVCPNGGSPRGDGTQACDCFENPALPTLAQVAYTGDYNDLINEPKITGDSLNDIVTAGSAGPTASKTITISQNSSDKSISGSGSISVPYFTVDSKGRIKSYTNRTLTVKTGTYSNYYNYYNYSNYYNYGNYYQYEDYNCNDGE